MREKTPHRTTALLICLLLGLASGSSNARADEKSPKKDAAQDVALVLVIDRSGSMTGAKIVAAKEAVMASIKTLPKDARAAVIAFDSNAVVVAKLSSATKIKAFGKAVDQISAGGGTNILPALKEAGKLLSPASAKRKHVIVLSDGHASYTGIASSVRDLKAGGVTVSTIGIGDFDPELLDLIAKTGGGRAHSVTELSQLSTQFVCETKLAQSKSCD